MTRKVQPLQMLRHASTQPLRRAGLGRARMLGQPQLAAAAAAVPVRRLAAAASGGADDDDAAAQRRAQGIRNLGVHAEKGEADTKYGVPNPRFEAWRNENPPPRGEDSPHSPLFRGGLQSGVVEERLGSNDAHAGEQWQLKWAAGLVCYRETGLWPVRDQMRMAEDGTEFDGGAWCNRQRMRRNGTAPDGKVITRAEVAILDAAEGWSWEPLEVQWQEGWQELKDFVAEHGRLPKTQRESRWWHYQQRACRGDHGAMTEEHFDQLQRLTEKFGVELSTAWRDPEVQAARLARIGDCNARRRQRQSLSAAAVTPAPPGAAADDDTAPVVAIHHPAMTTVTPLLMGAKSAEQLLAVFEAHHDPTNISGGEGGKKRGAFGWMTAKETLTRISKTSDKSSAQLLIDARFCALAAILAAAMAQGGMDSYTRLGHKTDDVSSVLVALEAIGGCEALPLHKALTELLEFEEENEPEEGDFGDDYEGGGIGF